MIYALATLIFVLASGIVILAYKYTQLQRHADKIENDLNEFNEFTSEISQINTDMTADSSTMRDSLTGLPNRQLFEDRLNQVVNQGQRHDRIFAVMALDVDNFSEICEKSPEIGDKLLQELARRLEMSTRQIDSVTRFGGAYFLFLLPVLYRPETAIYLAQRIQDNLLESFEINGHEFNITVSIGIAVFPVDGVKSTDLISNANIALQQAKKSGKNKYQFYQSDLLELGQRELNIATIIRSNEFLNQLRIQYKPFFNIDNNQPYYIQVLTNLYHPQYGMISLSSIANLIENSGKITEVNEWILKSAIKQLNEWKQHDFNPKHIAIPVSMRQLESSHFINKVVEIADNLKTLSTKIVLEVIDDAPPQNLSFLEKLFSLLEEADIRICIGVLALGHFAMQKFNRIPLHYLKIDKRLVQDATESQEKDIILSRIIQVAQDENIIAMAEGVDTEAQKAKLTKIGCSLMEGKLFGYLMPTGSVLQRAD